MAVHLDHLIVHCRDKRASASLLAQLLDVPSGPAAAGPFIAVYVNDGLTLDFDQTDEPFPISHYAFRVTQAEFDAVLARIRSARIAYRSTPHGPHDMQINTQHGGNMVYWNEPAGHVWELLTESYARQPKNAQ